MSLATITQQQVDSLSVLVADIAKRQSIPKSNVVAASEVNPARKSDFGKIRERVLTRAFDQAR
jgi:N-acetyl-anhydromuramyl-L-alanine amidase AmpD